MWFVLFNITHFCAFLLFKKYISRSTFLEPDGPLLSPPGPGSLWGRLCHLGGRGSHRCLVPSPLHPWLSQQWETQWQQVFGLDLKKIEGSRFMLSDILCFFYFFIDGKSHKKTLKRLKCHSPPFTTFLHPIHPVVSAAEAICSYGRWK